MQNAMNSCIQPSLQKSAMRKQLWPMRQISALQAMKLIWCVALEGLQIIRIILANTSRMQRKTEISATCNILNVQINDCIKLYYSCRTSITRSDLMDNELNTSFLEIKNS